MELADKQYRWYGLIRSLPSLRNCPCYIAESILSETARTGESNKEPLFATVHPSAGYDETGSITSVSRPSQWGKCILVFVMFLAFALALQYRNGAYSVGFGAFPDEPAHYVTGLMVHEYFSTGMRSAPMRFAERFYAHYPAVAFGHWPPALYLIHAVWGFLFGMSRTASLLLIAVISATASTLMANVVGSVFGRVYGAFAGLCFLMLPSTQRASASFMADGPLTMFTFVALMCCVWLVQCPSLRNAIVCGLAVSTAILVKGNAWALVFVVAYLALLVSSPVGFVLRRLSIIGTIVLIVCVPFTVGTIKMTRDGWEQDLPTVSYFLRALPAFFQYQVGVVGVGLAALAAFTVYSMLRPARFDPRVRVLLGIHIAAVASVLLFHALTPTSLEPRKMLMCAPSLLVLSVAGLRRVAYMLPEQWVEWPVPIVAGLILLAVNTAKPVIIPPHADLRSAAARVIANHSLDNSVVLVVSSSTDAREELSFVAEIAERERGQFSHAIIRGGKLLADSSWAGREYALRYREPSQLDDLFRSIPVAAIVMYTEGAHQNPHSALVGRYLADAGPGWIPMESQPSGYGRVQIFLCADRSSKKIELPSINLVRKLGRNVRAEF
jgi:hypothetical protein